MSLVFLSFGHKLELVPNQGGRKRADAIVFRDAQHAKQVLHGMLAYERGLHRLRNFLHSHMGWRDLYKRNDNELLAQVAEALRRGILQLEKTVLVSRPSMSGGNLEVVAKIEAEEWVELEPESAVPEEETETQAVSYEAALAMAESNRELAAEGTPFKELCRNKDCPVCNGHAAVTSS